MPIDLLERTSGPRDLLVGPAAGQDLLAKGSGDLAGSNMLDTVRGMFKQFWSDVRGPRSVMEGYDASTADTAAASPVSAAGSGSRPGGPMTTVERVAGDSIEARAARLRDAGMDPEVAHRQAGTDIAFGVDSSRRPASVQVSDFEGFDKSGPSRIWADYSSGVVGATGGTLAYAGRKLGISTLQEAGESMTRYAERITPTKQTFGDKVVNAIGSMASFYVPGVGVQRGAVALAALSPVAAKWAGAGAMAALEAAGEANSVYEANLRAGEPEAQAAKKADATFLLNLGLLSVTDRFGLFNDLGTIGKRIAAAAATEGPGQEGPQQVIQNYFTGRPLTEGVGEASAIGAIVGGGARGVHSAVTGPIGGENTRPTEVPERAPEPQRPDPTTTILDAGTVDDAIRAANAVVEASDAPLAALGDSLQAQTVVNAQSGLEETIPAEPPVQTAAPAAAEEARATAAQDLLGDAIPAGEPTLAPKTVAGVSTDAHTDTQLHALAVDPEVPANTRHAAAAALQARTNAAPSEPTQPVTAVQDGSGGAKDVLDTATGPAPQSASAQAANPVQVDFKGKSADQLTETQLNLYSRLGKTPEIRQAAVEELARRKAATSGEAPGAEPKQPTILGRQVSQLDTKLLQLASKLGTSRVRTVAQAELTRRAQAAQTTAQQASEDPSARTDGGSQPGMSVLGKPITELGDRALRLVVDTHANPVIRGAAEAEVARRASQDSGTDTLPAAGVLMTPAYAGTGQEVNQTGQARPDAIRQSIRQLFKVPINEGHFKKSRDTLGIYKLKPRAIRIRNQNDIGVIAHETGHHFSETSRSVRDIMKAHASELSTITPYAAQQKTPALKREEGFAEFLRLHWTEPAQAQARAPGFSKAFGQYIDLGGHRKAFDTVGTAIRDWQNLPPADRILAKVGRSPERPGGRELANRFVFEVLDRWDPVRRMVADLKPGIAPSKDPFKAAHLLAGDAAVIEDWITTQAVPFDPVKRADPKNYGKPLREILEPVAHDLKPFSAYLIARRANELMAHGKEHLYTKEEIHAGLRLETPEFKQAAKAIYAYNDRLIDYAVDGGLLSPEIANRLREYTAYIPFFRESEDGSGRGGGKNPFKRILGGTENIRDPIANLVQNTANIIYATNRNAVLAKAFALAKEVPGGGRWIEQIPIPDAVLNVPKRAIMDAFEKQGVILDSQSAAALAQIQKLVVPNPVEDKGERIVTVRIDGEPKALQVNDKLLWRALQTFEPADLGIVEKILSVPSDLLRAGVTLSPEFMARNFMRDTLSGFIQSKAGIKPIASTLAGFKEVATRSDVARLYRAFGGAYADMWKGDSEQTAKTLARMAKRGKFDPRTILTPGGVLRVLHALGSISEAGTRIGEFKKTAKAGGVDALIEAAYNAREVSVDFGVHGANQSVRLLTRITPFLNPAMQGAAKMVRTGREQFALTLFRGAFLTAFSVALYMQNRDTDWYDEIEQWEKNVYWHFDVGLRDKDGQVIPLRLPKPFEWGAIFGSVPEALTQLAIEQRGKDSGKRLASIWNDVFALRAAPTALLVPAEIWANRNTFTDRSIVPEGKAGLDPALQHGNSASLTARALGEATDTSPAQIDHVIRGFFGTMGVYATMLADLAARQFGDHPEGPAKTWRQMPVVRAFVHDPDNPNSRHINEFYDLLKEARQREASMRRGYEGTNKEQAYEDRYGKLIDTVPDANRLARELAKLRKDNEAIRTDPGYTAEEKRNLINENNREIKRTAKDFMRDATSDGAR